MGWWISGGLSRTLFLLCPAVDTVLVGGVELVARQVVILLVERQDRGDSRGSDVDDWGFGRNALVAGWKQIG